MPLSQREKQMVVGGVILLTLFVAFRTVVKPTADRLETLRRVVPEKERALGQLRSKSEEYLAAQREIDVLREAISSQGGDFRVLSFLENTERECGLARNVAYMKPTIMPSVNNAYVETRVEIKLENVSLRQITDFLLRIEDDKAPVGVKALQIRSAVKAPTLLDATVHLTSLTPADKR